MTAPKAIAREFEGLSLGDARLDKRALLIAAKVAEAPSQSFPTLLPTPGELEGAYRFFQNEEVAPDALMKPHIEASLKRARQSGVVRIVHDTTGLSFGGEREGLGTLGGGGCGFWAQMALAISGGEERAVLGVVGLETKVYPTLEEKARDHQRRCREWAKRKEIGPFPAQQVIWKGRDKWSTLPLSLKERLRRVTAIHVMDQEADNFEVFRTLLDANIRFVIRGSAKRRVHSKKAEPPQWVHTKLAESEIVLTRRVRLNARPKPSESHPKRGERDAVLSVRATRAGLVGKEKARLTLNIVEVFERRPPEGEEPIQWVLFTTEPVDTREQVAAVVDHYRARWRIEEFFKALKSGCSIEKRQLTTYEALMRALALFVPIAWHLLVLRTEAHRVQPVAAEQLLTTSQLVVLRALLAERKRQLPEQPSAADALLAIAALGGHLKRNGDPGWITLGRGYDRLVAAEAVWSIALRHGQRSDQS